MKIFFLNLITVCILPVMGFAQSLNPNLIEPRFEHITQKDGLPENSVFAIEQDYLGYMWFGTQNGLVKYDGYSMKVYQSELSNDQDDESKSITNIYEDRLKNLWVGTYKGLIQFNREKELFYKYINNPSEKNSLNSDVITCIYDDAKGNLWVGTDKGLNLFDRKGKKFKHFDFYKSNPSNKDYTQVKINDIIEYPSQGNLLLCIDQIGLFKFDITAEKFSEFKLCFNEKLIDNFYSFCLGSNNTLWIGCSVGLIEFHANNNICKLYNDLYYGNNRRENFIQIVESWNGLLYISFANGGLAVFDPATKTFQQILSEDNNPQGLPGNYINTVYIDRSGILWVGTWSSGLSRYDGRKQKFHSLIADPYDPNSLSSNYVMSILPQNPDVTWIITDKMLERWNVQTFKIDHLLLYENFSYEDYFGPSILDVSGSLWISTQRNGILKYNSSNYSQIYYFSDKNRSDISYNDRITIMHQDSSGCIWIGTLGQGLYKYLPKNDTYEVFRHVYNDSTSINNDEIITIYEDRNKTIWIGSNGGLNRYIPEKNSFRSIPNANAFRLMFEDSEGNFWLGTYMNGLSLLDRNSEKIISAFTEKDGITNNTICSIQEDHSGNLWIGTNNGLSKFNFEKKSFRNYYVQDGLNQDGFQLNASARGSDGTIYFGTRQSGLNYFDPDSIKDDPVPPQVVIENVSLFNRPDEKLSYEGFIPELDKMELPYNQNDLRFEYVGLHFSEPAKNKYKYILEGFDESWIDAGFQRSATYTNLDPGVYVFKVNATNRDGVWNETGTSIKIIINPPLWATTWAYLLYVILIASLLYLMWKLNVRRLKAIHEFQMSKFEAEKLHEVDELKSRFFANISHEFRTPLTLILGPAKDIIESTKESKTKQNVGLIKRNASRLLGLVNQLLDLSKLEAGRMKLETREENIIPLLKGLVLSFSSLADAKKIVFNFKTDVEELIVYLDKDKIEKIINNLLSNAFKFTSEGGKVEMTVTRYAAETFSHNHSELVSESKNDIEKQKQVQLDNTKFVKISISDNGIGIPKERIDKIFDRFYQVDGSHTREQEGTGIGLALTKELVELHKGNIEVESETGKGTTFIVRIPLGEEHLKPEEIIEEETEEKVQIPMDGPELIVETKTRKEKDDIDVLLDTDKPLLLLVEDNSDVRKYIISHMEDNYRIQEAFDGEDGVAQALNHIPDLIISDIMMPKMDGFEMCNKLKTDERTSHIPIIMLTAKATSQAKIAGYEIGADDYIMKPFDAAELKVRVKNLIEIRRKLQEKFRSDDFAVPSELSSIDEQFMRRVLSIINKHISEEEFSIEELGKEVAMSRQHLYRKLKAISGKNPSLFIRSIRLAKAKKLIKEQKGTISEISFLVGFNSPAYFNKCFKEEFGYSPGELT